VKLGKLAPKTHPKTLKFSDFAGGVLPNPAAKVYREYKTPEEAKLMYGNDRYGDCTCAGAANLLISATCHTGDVVIPTLQEVLDLYTAVSGFNQRTGANDNGAAMTDVLEQLRVNGLAGHKILAWAKIDHTNLQHRQVAVDLFGATYVGVQLPASAQGQFTSGQSWRVVASDDIEGGHAIIHPGYGSEGGDYVSWARWDQKASAEWERTYIDEEYVIITEDWLNKVTKKTPGGLDLATLEATLKRL
jgi:hypothetical protein